MRRESLYLWDIVQAADHIAEFIANVDLQTFQKSELLRSAVVQKLSIIGEAAGKISPELAGRYAGIPWLQMKSFRNILVHAYFGTDWQLVWRSAKNRCPILRAQVAEVLAVEFGDS